MKRPAAAAVLLLLGSITVLAGPAGDEEREREAQLRQRRAEAVRLAEELAARVYSLMADGREAEARALAARVVRLRAEIRALDRLLAALSGVTVVEDPREEVWPEPPEIPPAFEGPAASLPPVAWVGISPQAPRFGTAPEDLGLDWLARHQDPGGRWDGDGFVSQCRLNRCEGAGTANHDTGLTGLALLAFVEAGESHRHGPHRETVAAGLRYLVGIQDPDGCVGPRTDARWIYDHALASFALAEAYARSGSPLLRENAQRAADFLRRAQNPYLAWRYGVRPGDNDTPVSTFVILALSAAKAAGLKVGQECFDGMKAWIEKVTEPEYGRAGYTARGTGPWREDGLGEIFPADRSESVTAMAVLARTLIGDAPGKSGMIRKGADLLLRCLPLWDPLSGSIDMIYWYFGTRAMAAVGGDGRRRWDAAVRTALLDHQRRDGDEKGSWDPVDPWGSIGGRIYSTAVPVLTLLALGGRGP